MQILLQVVLLAVGFVMLIKGADWFVDGASALARRFGIPQLIIGLTIVAMGTSLPEAAISISAALKGSAGIAVGNILGSNTTNILLILGVSALLITIPVQRSTIRAELPFLLGISVLLPLLGIFDGEISRLDGGILWIFFLLYLGWMFWSAKSNREEAPDEEEDSKPEPLWKSCLFILIGGALVAFGSDVAVNAAVAIAKALGLSDRLIGLTIIALGTSLPELVTSVTAARKGSTDIAVGNIVGSNLFNILFVLGTSALITPVSFPRAFLPDSIISIAAAVLLFVITVRYKKLQRSSGIIMLTGFLAYYVWLFLI